jgi:hypothetical protein
MLGEKLGELRGKVTGQRVLPTDGPNPKVETSFEISGALLGVDATMLGTYWSVVRPDGRIGFSVRPGKAGQRELEVAMPS